MVYERLRRLIVEGEVPAGVKLSEAELATSLTVSRTPVREALSRLEGDGLVRAQGRGVHVAVLDDAALVDVLEARAELEAWAARRLADEVGRGQIAPIRLTELAELADETDRRTRSGEVERAIWSNRELHLRIVRLAGNPVVEATLERWWDQVVLATRHGLHRPSRVQAVAGEHEEILEAIRAGRADAAAEAARRHVLRTGEQLGIDHPGEEPDRVGRAIAGGHAVADEVRFRAR